MAKERQRKKKRKGGIGIGIEPVSLSVTGRTMIRRYDLKDEEAQEDRLPLQSPILYLYSVQIRVGLDNNG